MDTAGPNTDPTPAPTRRARASGRAPALAAALLLALAPAAAAQPGAAGAGATAEAAAAPLELPVTQLVLYTNGVAYVVHEGVVTGDRTFALPVPVGRMDDLLASLTLEDLGGGTVEPVRYGSRDPLGRVLGSYSLDLSANPTLEQLLDQARGERVRIEATQTLVATLVNVERVDRPDEGPRTYLTILEGGALRRLPLEEVRSLRFERPELQAELEAALAAVAQHRGEESSTVVLGFSGEGERRVRVAYLREMPVWKTTYRMLLRDDGTADVQGWAIVDNPTELDLIDVRLTFVAGAPVSFVPGLFEPVYVRRQRVETATTEALAPRPPAADVPMAAPAPQAARTFAAEAAADAAAPDLAGGGVEARATTEAGETTFAYVVSEPVTVGRFASALVPVLQARVAAPRITYLEAAGRGSQPLHGIRLVNDEDVHLAAGPVSLFDPGGFVGSALLPETGPGDERLLVFAVDQGVEVVRETVGADERVASVRVRGGFVETEVRHRTTTRYTILPRAGAERMLLLDHPARAGWTLVAPGPEPLRTAAGYRFGVAIAGPDAPEAAPGPDGAAFADVPIQARCDAERACTIDVVEERTEARSILVVNAPADLLATYLEGVELDAETRAVLEDLVELGRRLADTERQLAEERGRIDAIGQDQARIRQNMAALDRTSALYVRYLADLEAQEDQLVAIRERIDLLERTREELRRQVDAIVAQT